MKINNLVFTSSKFEAENKNLLKINSVLFSVNKLFNKLKISFLFFAVIVFFSNSFSQENTEKSNQVLLPQINKELLPKFFDEVHNGTEYKYDSERERIYKEQVSRIEIIYIPYAENKNIPNLSSVSKMNKYNPNLNFDISNFNPKEFNFIKYGINYYSSSDQFIRVDNQDYIIHILPYTNRSSK